MKNALRIKSRYVSGTKLLATIGTEISRRCGTWSSNKYNERERYKRKNAKFITENGFCTHYGPRELKTRHASVDISHDIFPIHTYLLTHFDNAFFPIHTQFCRRNSSCDLLQHLSHIDLNFNIFLLLYVTNRLLHQSQTSLSAFSISIHLADLKYWIHTWCHSMWFCSVIATISINKWRILITRKESGETFAV